MRLRLAVLAVIALLHAAAGRASAQDGDQVRFYFGGHSGMAFQLKTHGAAPGIDLSSGQQANGFVLGVNLGRHLGAELEGDSFQTDLKVPVHGKVGEYGMFSLIPQVRARYPLFDNRLTPYVTAGVGVQVSEFNDRKPPGIGRRIDAGGTAVVAAVGAGFEYFVANNVAWGLDARYLVSRGQEIRIDDRGGHANLDALMVTTSLRLLFPEGPDAPRAYEPPPWRPYLGIRAGGQRFIHENVGGGLEMEPELAAIGGALDQYFHIAVGVDISRFWGAELMSDGYKGTLRLRGLGNVGKLSLYAVMPEVRLRYPLLENRLVPYALAGIGVSYAESHDLKPPAADLDVSAENFAPIGAIGLGFDYFLVRNIALGLETRYVIDRGHEVTIQRQSRHVNLDSIISSIGLRIYFR